MTSTSRESDETVTIELCKAAALVLDDFLARWESEKYGSTLSIEHDAERYALDLLAGALEKQLAEPFDLDYNRILTLARDSLVEK